MSLAIVTSRTRRQHGRKPSWPYSVNWGSPQAQGLAYWWPGDPAGGNTLFELVCGKNGTLTNGPAWVPGPDGGMVIDGDATDDYISFSANGFANPSAAFWWFKPDDITNTDRRTVAPNVGSTGGAIRQNGSTLETLNTAGTTWNAIVSGLVADWQHVGAVYTAAGSCAGYRNGVPGSTAASTTPAMWQSQAWTYGANYAGFGSYFGSQIHDLRVYRTEVPASTIAAMYDSATRWDLYYQPGRRAFSLPGVTPGGSLLLRLMTEGLFVGGAA